MPYNFDQEDKLDDEEYEEYDYDEEYDEDPGDYEEDETPRGFFDDNMHYYETLEDWHADHMNPPGTIDCGDGYFDEDTGVFTEY